MTRLKSEGFAAPVRVAPTPKPQAGPADGAVQILSILQRDSRLIDFLMEDVSAYSDEQVGAAVRDVQQQARQSGIQTEAIGSRKIPN